MKRRSGSGQIVGYSDVVAQKSIPVSQFQSYQTRPSPSPTPQEVSRPETQFERTLRTGAERYPQGASAILGGQISPSYTDTPALDKYFDEAMKELLIKHIPIARLCKPIDIANAVLAVLVNDYMEGLNILLHGGKL